MAGYWPGARGSPRMRTRFRHVLLSEPVSQFCTRSMSESFRVAGG